MSRYRSSRETTSSDDLDTTEEINPTRSNKKNVYQDDLDTTEEVKPTRTNKGKRRERETRKNVYQDEDVNSAKDEDVKKSGGWCIPFIVYIIISAIVILGFIFSKRPMGETVTYVLLQLIWIVLIGLIIYWLCKSGKVGWAWFVLFLPLIIQIVWVVLVAVL